MNLHEELVQTFYICFQKLDSEGMGQCYHRDIRFSDPVFPELRGDEAICMWKMLCSQARNFELSYGNIHCSDSQGRANWEAIYTFSRTGRKVHNIITAEFSFKEGKIIRHRDSFSFWKWSRMALGPTGVILGWSPLLHNAIKKHAAQNLKRFMHKHQDRS